MNLLIIIWSMVAAVCGMLGLIQLFLWSNNRRDQAYLLMAVMAFSAMIVAFQEMWLFSTPDPTRYQHLLFRQNLAIAMVLVTMIWSVRAYLPKARTWAAVLITALWVLGLIISFFMPGNLTFLEVLSIEQKVTPWGDVFYVPNGTINPWKWMADITVLLIPLYVIDAAWRSHDASKGKRGVVITAGVVLFILFAGIEAIFVDSGTIDAPYMVSVGFLSLVFSLTWVYARDAVRARILALEIVNAQRETERLMRTNLMGEVAAALAHELNQPLAAILGNAQAAQKFLSGPEPDHEEIGEILTDIVRDDKRARDIILTMRHMLVGDESIRTLVDPESVVREAIDLLRPEFDKQGIVVRLEKTSDLPEVMAGRVSMQQIILNILINSEQALRESNAKNREIQVQLCGFQDGVEITLRDFGPGISQQVMSRLFDPFVTTKEGSLGIGLAICRRIVEAVGGQLTAENAEGGGARFRIWLPAGTV